MSQTPPFQHGHHSYDDLRKWHVDTHAETRKDYQDCATKDASPNTTDEKKVQVKRKTSSKKDEEPEVTKDKDNENISEKDTEDDSQQDSDKDQDSDVPFRLKQMKKLTPLKMKKSGSNSSKDGAQVLRGYGFA